jgi:hypothetical protein
MYGIRHHRRTAASATTQQNTSAFCYAATKPRLMFRPSGFETKGYELADKISAKFRAEPAYPEGCVKPRPSLVGNLNLGL